MKNKSFKFFIVIPILVYLSLFNCVFAQNKSTSHLRRWEFSFVLGSASVGPAADIEKAMKKDGFDETYPANFLGGPVEHPFSKTGFREIGFPWSINISYRINPKYGAALFISHNPIGITFGYHTGPEMFLFLNYYSTIIAPMIVYKLSGILQLSVGPGFFIDKMEQESGGNIIYREQKSRPGMIFSASLVYPQRTLFFVTFEAQYRYISKSSYGPFKKSYRITNLIQLNTFEANFSHIFIGCGIGMRL